MEEVWVTLISNAHGEGTMILDVCWDRETAFELLKEQPNMTVYVDGDGFVRGRPVRQRHWNANGPWFPVRWAVSRPVPVRQRWPKMPALAPADQTLTLPAQ